VRALINDIGPEHQSKIMRLVDKKDDKGLEEFLDTINAPDDMKGKLFRLIGLHGENAIHEARELVEILMRSCNSKRFLISWMYTAWNTRLTSVLQEVLIIIQAWCLRYTVKVLAHRTRYVVEVHTALQPYSG